EAERDYNQALPLFQEHGLPQDVATCLMNRANTLQAQGRYAEAERDYNQALPLFQQHGLPQQVARCLANRASTLDAQGQYAEAIAGYEQLDVAVLSSEEQLIFHSNLAIWYERDGHPQQALQHGTLARHAFRRARRHAGINENSLEFVADRQDVLHRAVRLALD